MFLLREHLRTGDCRENNLKVTVRAFKLVACLQTFERRPSGKISPVRLHISPDISNAWLMSVLWTGPCWGLLTEVLTYANSSQAHSHTCSRCVLVPEELWYVWSLTWLTSLPWLVV